MTPDTATLYRVDSDSVYRPHARCPGWPLERYVAEKLTGLRDGEVVLVQWDNNKSVIAFRVSVPPSPAATVERVSL